MKSPPSLNILRWLDIKGHIITIDAMGCQFKIANQIIKKEGDYIFSLKGNQNTLSEDVTTYFTDKDSGNIASHVDYDKGHGRVETRECLVVDNVEWLRQRHPKWSSIRSIIKIQSIRESKKTNYKRSKVLYFVTRGHS